MHLATERNGKPIAHTLTVGQRHERPQAITLLERRRRGAVTTDKRYRRREPRNVLAAREIDSVITRRDNETVQNTHHPETYWERFKIERATSRLKQYRCIATGSVGEACGQLSGYDHLRLHSRVAVSLQPYLG